MCTSSTPAEPGNNSNPEHVKACPKCKSVEAWHCVIVEPGESERFACDECGHVEVITPTELDFEAGTEDQGRTGDWIDGVLAHHRAAAADFGQAEWAALGKRMLAAQLDRDDMSLYVNTSEWVADLAGVPVEFLWRAADVGDEVARRLDEAKTEAKAEADRLWDALTSRKAHHINLHTVAPGRVEGSCSCGEWHPVAAPDAEIMWEAARAHREAATA